MCIDLLKNPVKSIMDAKKKRNMNKTLLVLIESAVLFAIASSLIVSRIGLSVLLVGSAIATFLVVVIGILLFGLAVHISATTLGGKGKYFHGLTSIAYAMLPISVGMLVASLLAFAPLTAGLQVIVFALSFALGFSMIYRGIKELYGMDMITVFVVVSIAVVVVFVSIYASLGLSLLSRVASLGLAY